MFLLRFEFTSTFISVKASSTYQVNYQLFYQLSQENVDGITEVSNFGIFDQKLRVDHPSFIFESIFPRLIIYQYLDIHHTVSVLDGCSNTLLQII